MKRTLTLMAMCLIYLHGASQPAKEDLTKGKKYLQIDHFDSARYHLERAHSVYQKNESSERLETEYWLGSLHKTLKQPEKALDLITHAFENVAILDQQQDTLRAMIIHEYGKLHEIHLNDFKQAMALYRSSLNITNRIDSGNNKWSAAAYSDIGYIHLLLNNLDSSLYYQKRSLEIRKSIFPSNHLEIAEGLRQIGGVYFFTGNYQMVRTVIPQIIDIYQQQKTDMRANISHLYTNICTVESYLENFHKAIEYGEQGLRYQQELQQYNYQGSPYLYYKLAIAYQGLKNYEKAEQYLLRSIQMTKDQNNGYNQTHADAMAHLSVLYAEMEEYQKSLDYANSSMKILDKLYEDPGIASKLIVTEAMGLAYSKLGRYEESESVYLEMAQFQIGKRGPKGHDLARSYLMLGHVFLDQKKNGQAVEYYDKAYQALPFDLSRNPIQADQMLLDIILAQAECMLIGSESRGNKNGLKKAYQHLKTADSVVSEIRFAQNNYNDKVSLLSRSEQLYKLLIESASKLIHEDPANKLQYEQDIFYFIGRSKSVLMQEKLADFRAMDELNLPDSLSEMEKDIKFRIDKNKSAIQAAYTSNQGTDTSLLDSLRQKQFELKRQLEGFINDISVDYPKYYNYKYNQESVSLREVQQLLNDDETVIDYFTTDSLAYAFVIDSKSHQIHEIPLTFNLAQNIDSLNVAMKNGELASFGQAAFLLYQQLIEPLQIGNTDVLIIPHGYLWNLNFDILIDSWSKDQDFRTLDYLLKRQNIHYAYSSQLLKSPEQKSNSHLQDCLAFSYNSPNDTTRGNFMSMRSFRNSAQTLPGTQSEVLSISEELGGDYYFGQFANESNFKNKADGYKILHLALHGEIDNADPMNSRLLFAQKGDTIDDNYLYSFELQAMNLNADLAVLSACNTGSGPIAKGEGIINLGRSFALAGCQSVVVSQWELSDEITPMIVENFYDYLNAGHRKSEALRLSKIDFLNSANPVSANPYYWGALKAIGNDQPIFDDGKSRWYWIGLVVFVVIGFAAFRRKNG